jgi:hypothetical protein
VEDPVSQVRWALCFLGIAVFCLQFWAASRFFRQGTDRERQIGYFLVSFYFALPLFSTRPMIETFCMPLLTLSAVWGAQYQRTRHLKYLVSALVFLAAASMMRFQAGVCWLGLFCLVAGQNRWKPWAALIAISAGLFVLTGLPDLAFSREFHHQLRSYVGYNLQFSGEHFGRMPFYVFFVLALALTLPPTFLARYRDFPWKKFWACYWVPASYFIFFLLAHSATPHKEERFIVPVLPVFLFCLVPLAAYLWNAGRWRKIWFLSLNSFLLVLACSSPAQKNLLSLTEWLNAHPEIQAVDSVEQALVFFPQAFLRRPIQWAAHHQADYQNMSCDRLTLVRSDHPSSVSWESRFKQVARFEPAWVEQLLVWANAKNARRGPLNAYLPLHCSTIP